MIISRDKKLLCPSFAKVLEEFERRLGVAHLPFQLFMGLRDFASQDELYAQGRTKPGNIVTNARGGDSLHNYGLAADYVLDGMPDKPGTQWSWEIKSDLNQDGANDWLQMAQIAQNCGMEAGYFWKKFPDAPHVQMTFGFTLQEIKEIYQSGSIMELWSVCGEKS